MIKNIKLRLPFTYFDIFLRRTPKCTKFGCYHDYQFRKNIQFRIGSFDLGIV